MGGKCQNLDTTRKTGMYAQQRGASSTQTEAKNGGARIEGARACGEENGRMNMNTRAHILTHAHTYTHEHMPAAETAVQHSNWHEMVSMFESLPTVRT